MNTTDTSTEAVKALMEGVTPGDWSYIGEDDNDFVVFAGGEAFLANVAGGRSTPLYAPDERGVVAFDIEDQANARFIAASRQLVPALLERAEKAEAERDALRAQKWDVKHTDTMNTIVQLGLARDAAVAELATLKAKEQNHD